MITSSFGGNVDLAAHPAPAVPVPGSIGAFLGHGRGGRPDASPVARDAADAVDRAAARLRAVGPCGGTVDAERAARALAAAYCAKALRGFVERIRRRAAARARHAD